MVEVGRDGDDHLVDRLADGALGDLFGDLQHDGADLHRRHQLVAHLHPAEAVWPLLDGVGQVFAGLLHLRRVKTTPDQPLRGVDRAVWRGEHEALGELPHDEAAVLSHRDDGGEHLVAFVIFDDLGTTLLKDSHRCVGRAEIDADRPAHCDSARTILDSRRRYRRDYTSSAPALWNKGS